MNKVFGVLGAALMLLPAGLLRAEDSPSPDVQQSQQVRIVVHGQEVGTAGSADHVYVVTEGEGGEGGAGGTVTPDESSVGGYWVGIMCQLVPGALSAQLGLEEGQGVLVGELVPDGPAAKAGIQVYDVLVKAGERALKDPRDLLEVVKAAKDKELTIELYRGAKKETVKVTPAKRPAEAVQEPEDVLTVVPGMGAEEIQKWMERLQSGKGFGGPIEFRSLLPGAILPPGAPVKPLPENLKITITKQGDKPAEIKVEKDDQKWEVTDKELDKLPEDVRPHVERMLGGPIRLPMRMQIHRIEPKLNVPEQVRPRIWIEGQGDLDRFQERMDNRMEEMRRQIEKLQKSLEDLRQVHPQPEKTTGEGTNQM